MGQIEDLKLFTLVVEQGGVSGAAEKLNIAKSAVSRRLALLEDRYAARLVDRAPGVWAVTATGRELYQRAARIVAEMDEIQSDFAQAESNLAGPLRVSVPYDFGAAFLAPALLTFQRRYPDIQLTVDFEDRRVDLARENYDFAIRVTQAVEEGVIAQKIGAARHLICASPAYLAAHGAPESLEALSAHALLNFGAAKRAAWRFGDSSGAAREITFQPAMNANSGRFLLQAAEQGHGIVHLPDFICGPSLAAGALVEVLARLPALEWGIYLIHAEDRRLNRRMRRFAESIISACLEGESGAGDSAPPGSFIRPTPDR